MRAISWRHCIWLSKFWNKKPYEIHTYYVYSNYTLASSTFPNDSFKAYVQSFLTQTAAKLISLPEKEKQNTWATC